MAKLTYHVRKAEAGWIVEHDGNEYAGYRSATAAIKAATDIAQKLSLNGHDTAVLIERAPGSLEQVWTSANQVPTIDSLLEEFSPKGNAV